MHIETIPHDFIISATAECMGTMQSDFVLKAVRFRNESLSPVTLTEIAFDVVSDEKQIKKIVYTGEALASCIASFPGKVKGRSAWGLGVMIGKEKFWEDSALSSLPELLPGKETGMVNEFFLVVDKRPVNRLDMSVSFTENGTPKTETRQLRVIEYKTKNRYILPVKGSWQINGNYDCIGAHRTQYSMEFAMDFGRLDHNSITVNKQDMADEEYLAFGKEILAIADGEVVECYNDTTVKVGFPNDRVLGEAAIAEKEAILASYGRMPIQCGNYVVLRHANEEYSLYGHMLYHSQPVKKGDLVKQGDVLGRIGNTGKSGTPHLHFHLMNGPEYTSARGLPCHFVNAVGTMNDPIDLVREEYTIVHAE